MSIMVPNTRRPPASCGTAKGEYRLVMDSPGDAGIGLVKSLRSVCSCSDREIARRIFQSPSLLLSDLDRNAAEKLSGILNQTGAKTRVLPAGREFVEGKGEYEIALVVRDIERIGDVLATVCRLLHVQPVEVINLMVRSPAGLAGNLSLAAAEAFRDSLSVAGAELDISKYREARFDVFLGRSDDMDRRRIREILVRAGIDTPPVRNENGSPQPMAATDLGWNEVDRVRKELTRFSEQVKILNRDFARFDIVLQRTGDHPRKVSEILKDRFGIPGTVHARLLGALPVALAREVPCAEVGGHLNALESAGATAGANMTSLQTFDLRIDTVESPEKTISILAMLGGKQASSLPSLRNAGLPALVEGPFTPLQARWLQKDLRAVGTRCALKLR